MLHNLGPADARNIDMREVDPPAGGELLIREGLPIPHLPPHHRFPVLYIGAWGVSPAVDLEITWTDDEGPHNKPVRVFIV